MSENENKLQITKEDVNVEFTVKVNIKGFYSMFDETDFDEHGLKPNARPNYRGKDLISDIKDFLIHRVENDLWEFISGEYPEDYEYIDDMCDDIEILVNNTPVKLYKRKR